MSITYRGMNVSEPDVTTPEELEAFFGFTDQPTGRPLESYALWAELRPDVLKRLLGFVHHIHESESWSCPLPYLTSTRSAAGRRASATSCGSASRARSSPDRATAGTR